MRWSAGSPLLALPKMRCRRGLLLPIQNMRVPHFSRVLREVGLCSSTPPLQAIVVPTFRKGRERWGTHFIAYTQKKSAGGWGLSAATFETLW
jgi:hypothetical protein